MWVILTGVAHLSKAGPKTLKKGEYLFREGDNSDAMYVIKSGRIAITKAKGSSEIVLAELVAGEMLGEMAFFDNRPRSASARALTESVAIALPFSALHAQFKTFPEWLKAMVKTINTHLRNANQRIKNLEQAQTEDEKVFAPHVITRLTAILVLLANRFGKKTEAGYVLPGQILRDYTIQIFQEPTHKMQKLIGVLEEQKLAKQEDLGDGVSQVIIQQIDFLTDFFEWYNRFLFSKPEKRVVIEERELPLIRGLIFYGSQATPDNDKNVTVSLTDMQNNSMRDLEYLVRIEEVNPLIEKKVIGDKIGTEEGHVLTKFKLDDLKNRLAYWSIIYALEKIRK